MKNSMKAFTLHLIIVGITFVLLIGFVSTGPTLGRYTTNIVSRVFFIIVLIAFYVYAGTLLDVKKDKRYDFLAGSIIAIVGIGLWLYTFFKTDKNLIHIPKELSEYWIVFNLYHSTFTMIYFFWGVTTSPILSLFTNLLPSLLIGCGMKYKRLKLRRIL